MIRQKWLVGPLALALSAGATGTAFAQQNQPAQGAQGGNQGGARGNFQNMTPEQRAAMQAQRQAQRETQMRQQMTAMGFTDTAIQDKIIAFVNSEAAATQQAGQMGTQVAGQTATQPTGETPAETPVQKLRQKGRQLALALQTQAVKDADLRTLLLEYNQAVEDEKARRAKAISDLRAALNLDDQANTRLEAFLTVSGLIVDLPASAGGGGARGGRGAMGVGGGGGMMGGGQGAMGGGGAGNMMGGGQGGRRGGRRGGAGGATGGAATGGTQPGA
jgi:hypothetical protein